jgi:hypothetical protein
MHMRSQNRAQWLRRVALPPLIAIGLLSTLATGGGEGGAPAPPPDDGGQTRPSLNWDEGTWDDSNWS